MNTTELPFHSQSSDAPEALRRVTEKYGHLFKPTPEGFYETPFPPVEGSPS